MCLPFKWVVIQFQKQHEKAVFESCYLIICIVNLFYKYYIVFHQMSD